MSANKPTMGHIMRLTRRRLRLTQRQAAYQIGVHNSTLRAYELGLYNIPVDTLERFVMVYGLLNILETMGYRFDQMIYQRSSPQAWG